ncbi:hypothetical protein EVC37_10795 [Methylocaldum sp. BRCS4]|jgi:tetratricopeptide (TPR) repeat protein|nr:hypothetical protein [Methylocaldum sp. BRCS4]
MYQIKSRSSEILAAWSLAGLAGLAYWIYSAAFGAEFNFDDLPNLHRLESIKDLQSAFQYIVNGAAGPLGRPIALASFALQFSAWPNAPSEFIHTNTLIHLVNGLLIAWLGLRLARIMPNLRAYELPFATTLFGLWTFQPILASASLMVVQRMTTLSSAFMLAGLIGYLSGRGRISQGKGWGWSLMIASLAFGTVLAIFTKETGALLPIYVWVLEYTLLFNEIPEHRTFPIWRKLLNVPVLALFVYGALHFPSLFDETQRGFSSYQRLISEGGILWSYLRLIFLPRAADLGPFHDDFPVAESFADSPESFFAWLVWAVLIATCIGLRQRFPWISFAFGWYLLGHSLESTIFNLELYFEHRNYMPSVGPLTFVSAVAWSVPTAYQRATIAATSTYLLLLGFVLHEVTSAWGNPSVSAQLWAQKHPGSERAQQFYAQRFTLLGDHEKSLEIIENAFENNPSNAGFALQIIQMSCYLQKDISNKIEPAISTIRNGTLNYAALNALEKLLNMHSEGGCPGLAREQLHSLIDALLSNHRYSKIPSVVFDLHQYKARLYFEGRELDPAVKHLEQAFESKRDLDTAVLIVGFLSSAGLYDVAQKKLEEFEKLAPVNPFLRQQWQSRLKEIQGVLTKQQKTIVH